MKSTRMVMMSVFIITLSGCAYGRSPQPMTPIQLAAPPPNAYTIIVTDFYEGAHRLSSTRNQNIVTLRESMEVRDISPQIAKALRQRGFNATAKKHLDHTKLQAAQLLLRGTAQDGPIEDVVSLVKVVLCVSTACILGGLISIPHTYTCGITYSLELLNAQGEYLLSEPKLLYIETYKAYPVMGSACERDVHMDEDIKSAAHDALINIIAQSLREQTP